jgi:primosomal protein N'
MNDLSPRLVDVAVDGVLQPEDRGILTYAVPERWNAPLEPGHLVWVPLRKRIELGIVVGETDEIPEFEIRALHAPVDPPVALHPVAWDTAQWLARETVSTLYAAASLFLPPGIQHRRIEMLSRVDPPPDTTGALTRIQQRVIDELTARGRMTIDQLRTATGQALTSVIPALVDLGLVRLDIEVDQHVPRESTIQIVRLLDGDPGLTSRSTKQEAVRAALVSRQRLLRDDDAPFTTVEALRDRLCGVRSAPRPRPGEA